MMREYRILLLEDVDTDAEIIERQLKKDGLSFKLKRVENEDDFVRELRDFAPDIILSDYHLPQFNGLDALLIVKRDYPDLPFILISGALGDELAVETIKSGAADYLLKDRLARLGPAVQRTLRESETLRIQKELEARVQALELQEREMTERELKIRKLQMDIEDLRAQLKETIKH